MGETIDKDICKECVFIQVLKEILFSVLRTFDKALWALIVLALGERLTSIVVTILKEFSSK